MTEEKRKLTEQEAIAEALRIGEEMRRESDHHTAWYARRIGIAISVLGIALISMLFAYTVLDKSDSVPLLGMVATAAVIAVGVIVTWWGYTREKPGPKDLY